MYVEIDREALVFLRKMEHQPTLSKLSSLEHPDKHVVITPAAFNGAGFTDLEMKMLIKNSHGPDVKHVFSRDTLAKILNGMIATFPVEQANAFEVEMQLRAIPSDDTRPYQYVRGAFKAREADEGEQRAPLCYEGAGDALGAPASAPQPSPQPYPAGTQAQAFAAPPRPAPAPAADGDFTQPRPGTSTHDIFSFCAQEWDATGRANDEQTLTTIRKRALDTLTKRGINASTVRTQAMRWYHNRTRFAG